MEYLKDSDAFNEKYKDFLEDGHYGLTLDLPEALEYLDREFQTLIKIPDFKYSQIKSKFNWFCFYADNVPATKCYEIEQTLSKIYAARNTSNSGL